MMKEKSVLLVGVFIALLSISIVSAYGPRELVEDVTDNFIDMGEPIIQAVLGALIIPVIYYLRNFFFLNPLKNGSWICPFIIN